MLYGMGAEMPDPVPLVWVDGPRMERFVLAVPGGQMGPQAGP